MMQEIYQRGPIACGIAVPKALMNYTGGIFKDETGEVDIDHEVSVVGWGVENGEKYWIVRNSWGSYWGEDGFFRLVRGINNIAIETDCSWATPVDTWTTKVTHKTTQAEKDDPRNKPYQVNGNPDDADFLGSQTCRRVPKLNWEQYGGEKKTGPMAWETIDVNALPQNWDWRNVGGKNYLGWNKNQHIPTYCGSCWAQGTTSALGDRFNILYKGLASTPIDLNAQVMVNCRAGGTCNGGDPIGVYEYAYKSGIPDSTCE